MATDDHDTTDALTDAQLESLPNYKRVADWCLWTYVHDFAEAAYRLGQLRERDKWRRAIGDDTDVCGEETRHPQSRVTSYCELPKGHEGPCEVEAVLWDGTSHE